MPWKIVTGAEGSITWFPGRLLQPHAPDATPWPACRFRRAFYLRGCEQSGESASLNRCCGASSAGEDQKRFPKRCRAARDGIDRFGESSCEENVASAAQ